MKKIILNLALVSATLAMSGCISHKTVVRQDVERAKVEFENESAARIFYEKLSHMPVQDKRESRTEFCIPVVFEWEKKIETSDNQRFNEAVRRCDTNQDGKITENEAKIFQALP
jgi:hypothetical protein